MLLALTALLGWTLVSALLDGQIVTSNRAGPKLAYSQALQPTKFYIELLWQGTSTPVSYTHLTLPTILLV